MRSKSAVMGRASRGVRGIMLSDSDELAAMLRVTSGETMLLGTTNALRQAR